MNYKWISLAPPNTTRNVWKVKVLNTWGKTSFVGCFGGPRHQAGTCFTTCYMFLIWLGMNAVNTPKISPHLLEAVLPSPTHKVRLFSTFKPWHPINQCAPRSTIPRANDVFADGVHWEPKSGFHVLGKRVRSLLASSNSPKVWNFWALANSWLANAQRCSDNFALKRVSSIPTTTCILSTKFSVWKLSLTKKKW